MDQKVCKTPSQDRKVKQVLCGGGTGHKEKVKEEDVTEGFCIYAL
jgi:hypothetical protein